MSDTAPATVTGLDERSLRIDDLAGNLLRFGAAIGVFGLLLTAFLGVRAADAGKQFFHSYLLALTYFLSLGIGALFFVTLQYLTRAGWSVVVRRLAELFATSLPLLAVLFVPVLVAMVQGNASLYLWVDKAVVAQDALLAGKQAYLNVPFFLARFGFYFLVWTGLSRHYLKQSLQQDSSGELRITARLQSLSAPAMAVFALSTTFASFDLLMSLQPHWYSTIFGVYFFAGSVVGFFALTILTCLLLQRAGYLRQIITVEHYHDMGKFLFGFVFFWGYIAFSQYMLIWYGNMPEETEWFLQRQSGDWLYLSLALLFGHFLIPFPGLISRHAKRNTGLLAFWAVFMLIMHWVDLYWLIMPSLRAETLPLGLIDLSAWLGIGGLFVANFGYMARGSLMIPVRDPHLAESLAFQNA
jgi:hypothetical protein